MALPEFEERVRRAPKWGDDDCDTGWRGRHLKVFIGNGPDAYWTCLNCGRRFA